MSVSDGASASTRSFISEVAEEEVVVRMSLDLVAAARRNIGFLRCVAEAHWLHHNHVLVHAIRRYDELWMPMVSELTAASGKPPMILPPLDIEWVWFCHTLNPASYRQYCESRYSKLIGKAAIFNEENEDYALDRCRDIWKNRYPSEPFENESDWYNHDNDRVCTNEDLLGELLKQRRLCTRFSRPFMLEVVYLIAAKQRYKRFLHLLQRFADSCSTLVPTSDILLMWITHKSYPAAYAVDVKEMEGNMCKVAGSGESVKVDELEETKKLWERIFDQPYEKAGCPAVIGVNYVNSPVYWDMTDTDVNIKYKPLLPRFLLEVNVMVRLLPMTKTLQSHISKEFIRFRLLRCHQDLKINKPLSNLSSNSWRKVLHLYCEFGTKGMILELRGKGGLCLKGSRRLESTTFLWSDLLRAPSITLDRAVGQRVRIIASITPPVQAPYLLKCVPDRVTDNSRAMISDLFLKMNQYRPQEGRWLSRTVLDHAGRESFVILMRMGEGIWRRGGERPSTVKWEDRIIEIREGSWSYVGGSIGKAPEKVVGTAAPKAPPLGWQASWCFSTGHELFIQSGGSSTSTSGTSLAFELKSSTSADSQVRLLKGRQMQYQEKNSGESSKQDDDEENREDEEEGFVTLVRFTEENPTGRATALLNWKLSVVEFLPDEDAAFVLLLSVSILRSISEMRKEDIGNLLTRRRLKEAKHGARDWGSVILHSSLACPLDSSSPYVRPWYWNAEAVMAHEARDYVSKQPAPSYPAEDGGDQLYKRALLC